MLLHLIGGELDPGCAKVRNREYGVVVRLGTASSRLNGVSTTTSPTKTAVTRPWRTAQVLDAYHFLRPGSVDGISTAPMSNSGKRSQAFVIAAVGSMGMRRPDPTEVE